MVGSATECTIKYEDLQIQFNCAVNIWEYLQEQKIISHISPEVKDAGRY